MGKTLMILEVSRKQDYIFSSKRLRENAARSADINRVTGSNFFQRAAGTLYREECNLVYAGGGHTVLQFDNADTATQFAQKVTETALREFAGLELFAKQLPYDATKTPGDNLKALSAALEQKKALRKASFRQMSFGVEALDGETFLPKRQDREASRTSGSCGLDAPEGWTYPAEFQTLVGEDNFIAVVHIDGNAMGARVESIYGAQAEDWDNCCAKLRRFSEGIQRDFEQAFLEMADEVIGRNFDFVQPPNLPIRPVILAGDDVCFVTAGKLGLECARVFLEKLTAKCNQEDGKPYAACAGVAMVHQKFPFHQAYDLAEELCSNAKKFGAAIDQESRISAMDWHIEFGQLKDSLNELRQDYNTEDGNRLELRPVTVVVPEGCRNAGVRSYAFFAGMCRAMKGEYGKIARSKIKELRTAFKQGAKESKFFLHDKEIDQLLYHAVNAEYADADARHALYRRMQDEKELLDKAAFRHLDGEQPARCLFFDAIEMLDHCTFFEEAKA